MKQQTLLRPVYQIHFWKVDCLVWMLPRWLFSRVGSCDALLCFECTWKTQVSGTNIFLQLLKFDSRQYSRDQGIWLLFLRFFLGCKLESLLLKCMHSDLVPIGACGQIVWKKLESNLIWVKWYYKLRKQSCPLWMIGTTDGLCSDSQSHQPCDRNQKRSSDLIIVIYVIWMGKSRDDPM